MYFLKSCWRETKNLSTNAVAPIPKKISSSKAKFTKKKKFIFARPFYILYEQKFSNLRSLLSITFFWGFQKSKQFGHWTLWNGGKKTFKLSEPMKKIRDFFYWCGDFKPFMSTSCQIWDHFFLSFFPQGLWKSEKFGYLRVGSGSKKTIKRSEKVWRTNRQTDKRVFWLIERIGPEGRFFEKIFVLSQTTLKFVKEKDYMLQFSLAFLLIALDALYTFEEKKV